jgi:putative membrane protein
MRKTLSMFLLCTFFTIGLLSCCPFFTDQAGTRGGWGGMAGYGMGGMFMGILFIIVVIVVIYLVIRMLSRNLSESGGGETPLDILKKRYAKGEISKEEFDRMKDELKS